MKRLILLAIALCMFVVPAAHAGVLYVQVTFIFTFHNNLTYTAEAWYDYDMWDFRAANVYGVATLNGSNQASQYFGPIPYHPDIAEGTWDFAGSYMTCYEVHATAVEDINGTTQGAGSGTHCAYWEAPYYNVLISTNVDGMLNTLRNDRHQEGDHGPVLANYAAGLSIYRLVGHREFITGDGHLPDARPGYDVDRELHIRWRWW